MPTKQLQTRPAGGPQVLLPAADAATPIALLPAPDAASPIALLPAGNAASPAALLPAAPAQRALAAPPAVAAALPERATVTSTQPPSASSAAATAPAAHVGAGEHELGPPGSPDAAWRQAMTDGDAIGALQRAAVERAKAAEAEWNARVRAAYASVADAARTSFGRARGAPAAAAAAPASHALSYQRCAR